MRLAELLRAGELTPVWVPEVEQEAIRDLVRTRDDFKTTQLMAYLGLVPSEHSSGPSRQQGGITKSGNGHVRRLLIESAWCYRFSARRSRDIEQRAQRTNPEVQAIAWKAQRRLCGRYRALSERGMSSCKVVTAVARELCGFIWSVAQQARHQQASAS